MKLVEDKAEIRRDYARAVDLLTEVVARRWDPRYAEIELPVLMELNRILAETRIYGLKATGLNSRLLKLLDVDLRIVLTCPTENSGLRLQVTEPSGEKASRSHNRTTINGLVTRPSAGDILDEYLIHRAMNGRYAIQATGGGTARPGPLTVQVDIFTNFGRDNQQCRSIMVRLKEKSDTVSLGEVQF